MRLLDTSVLVTWGDPAESERVLPYLQRHAEDRFVTSSLVLFEFFRPAKRRSNSQEVRAWLGQVLDGIEPFGEGAALRAAAIEASLASQDRSLSMRDLLIAAHADDIGATFVTVDRDDFEDEVVGELLDVDVIAD